MKCEYQFSCKECIERGLYCIIIWSIQITFLNTDGCLILGLYPDFADTPYIERQSSKDPSRWAITSLNIHKFITSKVGPPSTFHPPLTLSLSVSLSLHGLSLRPSSFTERQLFTALASSLPEITGDLCELNGEIFRETRATCSSVASLTLILFNCKTRKLIRADLLKL